MAQGTGQSGRSQEGWLLPSLKDGPLKATIESHFATQLPALHDARKFDNYELHAGAIQGGSTPGFAVLPYGKAYFPFPDDPTSNRIGTWGRIPGQRRPRRAVVLPLGQDICRCRNIHRRHAGRFRRSTITDGAQGKRGAARAVVGATARPVVDMSWTMTTILRIGVKATGRTASVTSYHSRAKRHCDGLRPLICPELSPPTSNGTDAVRKAGTLA